MSEDKKKLKKRIHYTNEYYRLLFNYKQANEFQQYFRDEGVELLSFIDDIIIKKIFKRVTGFFRRNQQFFDKIPFCTPDVVKSINQNLKYLSADTQTQTFYALKKGEVMELILTNLVGVGFVEEINKIFKVKSGTGQRGKTIVPGFTYTVMVGAYQGHVRMDKVLACIHAAVRTLKNPELTVDGLKIELSGYVKRKFG